MALGYTVYLHSVMLACGFTSALLTRQVDARTGVTTENMTSGRARFTFCPRIEYV